jgi:hypothetical protein
MTSLKDFRLRGMLSPDTDQTEMYVCSMLRLLSSIVLDPFDWIAICFVVVMLGGLLLALFLYFRTAFKAGGWRNVRNSAWIALVAWFSSSSNASSKIAKSPLLRFR